MAKILYPYGNSYPTIEIELGHDLCIVRDTKTGLTLEGHPHDALVPFTFSLRDGDGFIARQTKGLWFESLFLPEHHTPELQPGDWEDQRRDHSDTGGQGREHQSRSLCLHLNGGSGMSALYSYVYEQIQRPFAHGLPYNVEGDSFSAQFMNPGVFPGLDKGYNHNRTTPHGWDAFDYGHSHRANIFALAAMKGPLALMNYALYMPWMMRSTHNKTAWCAQPRSLMLLQEGVRAQFLKLGEGDLSQEYLEVMCAGITPSAWLDSKVRQLTDGTWWSVYNKQHHKNLGQGLANLDEVGEKGEIATWKSFHVSLGLYAMAYVHMSPQNLHLHGDVKNFAHELIQWMLTQRALEIDGRLAYNVGSKQYSRARAMELRDMGNRWRETKNKPAILQAVPAGDNSGMYVIREAPKTSNTEILVGPWAYWKGLDDRWVKAWLKRDDVEWNDKYVLMLRRMLEIGSNDLKGHPRSELLHREKKQFASEPGDDTGED